jgi:hypothetical protein
LDRTLTAPVFWPKLLIAILEKYAIAGIRQGNLRQEEFMLWIEASNATCAAYQHPGYLRFGNHLWQGLFISKQEPVG